MQDKHLFEYAVIRVVPRVEREEFVNAGVVLYCAKQKYLQVKFTLVKERLHALSPHIDIAEVQEYLSSFEDICKGVGDSPISKLAVAERFRWLTATRSTVVQTSKVHPGFCSDGNKMLEHLYEQLVL